MSALGRPAEATAELGPGSRLGPYQLVYAVAQGGMARVWAALDTTSGSVVAVKTIRPELAHDAGYRRLFEDEARYASSVEHPNVCRVFGLAEEGGVLYIARAAASSGRVEIIHMEGDGGREGRSHVRGGGFWMS